MKEGNCYMDKIFLEIESLGNSEQGFLSFFESNREVPFNIKRIYYIYNVPVGIKRGMHAHKKLRQILWCPFGEIEVILDNGKAKKSYLLDSPEKALLVKEGYWHDMHWKMSNSVLCVAASDYYNEDDYIRNYDDFLKYVEEGYWDEKSKL